MINELYGKLRELNVSVREIDGRLDIQAAKGVLNKEMLEEIKNHKEGLITLIRSYKSKKNIHHSIPGIESRPDYVLSSAQRRLWLVSQREEGSIAYNIPGAYLFEGELDIPALEYGLSKLIERHEILRTVFREDGQGQARQWVRSPQEIPFTIRLHDLRKWEEPSIAQLIQAGFTKPFDLVHGPLFRADVYRTGESRYIFAYTMHHIISDGWSMDILIKEMLLFYTAYINGKDALPEPLGIQYKDYAAWERTQSATAAFQEHRQYWLNQFGDEWPSLELPLDKPRPAIKTYNGAAISKKLDKTLILLLKAYCQAQESTLFMGLLAAVNAILYRYTGQNDIVIGSPIAGREHADLNNQIGAYINTLALRTKFNEEAGYKDLLAVVRQTTLEAYQHQAYPFDELAEALRSGRNSKRSALFDVMVVMQNAEGASPAEQQVPEGLKVLGYDSISIVTSKFDLTFTFKESGDGLLMRVEYNKDIFHESSVVRLTAHWEQLLAAMLESPASPLCRLEYLTAGEKHQLLTEFNDSAAGYPSDKTLISLWEEQVDRTPSSIAVVSEARIVTYRELNEWSNQLGDYLRRTHDIQPGDRIGVLLPRNEWAIIAILGILKSGGGYVPVDPLYPRERIDYMIFDSGCRIVIDEEELVRFREVAKEYDRSNLRPVNKSSDLAYVIYTSGTTGNPKGTLIAHDNVVRLFKTDRMLFDFNERDVWTLFHSLCFDFSVWEMYGALLFGGKLVILSADAARDPYEVLELLNREGVTVLNQTPSAFYNLVKQELERDGTTLPLRYVIFGGEALSPGKLAAWRQKHPAIKLINMYGITETTVHVTYKEITETEITANASNIGRPIPTLTCYVLDREQRLVPIGVPGELYVGGEGVSRGYLNREELTRQKFIESPFKAQERLYRSGDKVKRLANGELEYMGRIDDQVKIRGYRIELGEIENALRGISTVEDAVVLARMNGQEDRHLVAYIMSREEPDIAAIRSSLAARLPDYFIPSYFIRLAEFPITKNGKLDKKALPEPTEAGMAGGSEFIAPRNEVERQMTAIWENILGRNNIGVRDNFFELGGDSINILRMISEVKARLDWKISMASVYRHNTIEGLAIYAADNIKEIEEDFSTLQKEQSFISDGFNQLRDRLLAGGSVPDPEDIADIYPMSAIQRGMLFSSLLAKDSGVYHDQFVYQRVFPDFRIERLQLSMEWMVEKHPILRTSFNTGEYETDVQIVHKKVPVVLSSRDLAGLEAADQEKALRDYLNRELSSPFDIGRAPLWRMTLFNLGSDRWAIAWQFHHAILDGWSNASLITELNNLYEKLMGNPLFVPAKLQSSYRDFVIREEITRRSSSIREFWKDELTDFTRLDLFSGEDDFKACMYDFGSAYLNEIQQAAADLNTTVRVISLSAYLYMLKVLASEEDIVTGLVTNGRPELADSDKMLGCFLNSIPLKMRINGQETCADLISRVDRKLVELKDKEKMTLAEISSIHPDKQEGGNPFFDVLFNYVDFHIYKSIDNGNDRGGDDNPGALLFGWEKTNTFLDFSISVTGGSYTAQLNAARRLSSGIPADKILSLFAAIVTYFIDNPRKPLKQLDLLEPGEKEKVLSDFNGASGDKVAKISVIELFERQAKKTPERTALIFEEGSLTYRELNEKANRFAAHLRKTRTIRTDDLVGILLGRSEWMVIAILAIWKCGGAYLPVDPEYPEERIRYIREDSRCKWLIDHWELEKFNAEETFYGSENQPFTPAWDDLAYVIYTSGSTGLPKGTAITHDNLSGYVQWANSYYYTGLAMVHFGLFTSLSFDLTVTSLFCPLTQGGNLRVYPSDMDLIQILSHSFGPDSGINCIKLTPSHINLLRHLDIGPSGMACAIVGGEEVNPDHVSILKAISPSIRVYNEYGPTEATVGCIVKELEKDAPVLIGKPISRVRIYILDKHQALCPVGIPGEIYIGGAGLARGYLNRPGLTAERFIPDPFMKNERVYKTGDGGRWLPDGDVTFLGRLDQQVKIRGYRIELDEIESALLGHPDIESAVVMARCDSAGEKDLVAYLTGTLSFDTDHIRSFLAKTLPAYMLPNHFVRMESLPMTPNGKLDKKRLPDPAEGEKVKRRIYIPPANEEEERLIIIWQDILGKEHIGMKDNFFELGGHSLKAMRLFNRVHKDFSVGLSLKTLLDKTTPELQMIEILRARKTSFHLIPAAYPQPHYPLSPSQRRLWVLSQLEESNVAYNLPAAYILKGELDRTALEFAFGTMIERHEILRTVFRLDEYGEIRQFIRPATEAGIRIEYGDFRETRNLEDLVTTTMTAPFDLASGPLLRTVLCQTTENKWVFAFVMHHIISDGWSMEVLFNELLLLYNIYRTRAVGSLAPLRIQYKDYAVWQQGQLSAEATEDHKSYWLRQLEGDLPVLELAGDRVRPAIKTYQGGMVRGKIPPAVLRKVHALCYGQESTLFMGMLAAVMALLYRYTGQTDIIIGSPVTGREHIDLENQIGFYINSLPFRARFNDTDNYRELLGNIRQTTLAAYEHRIYPFDELVDLLNLRRDMSRNPLFDVMVTWQDKETYTVHQRPDPIGIEIDRYRQSGQFSSKFDLIFNFVASGDEVQVNLEYNTDIFDDSTVIRMAAHLEQLLSAITDRPSTPLCELDYLNKEEKHRLLQVFNHTTTAWPEYNTAIDLFEAQVERTPENIALVCEGTALTYRELNECANQLGRYMVERHEIGDGDLLGLKLQRDEWIVISILAVLKSGAGYVPIDPEYPADRVAYIISDSACKALLDEKELAEFRTVTRPYAKNNFRRHNMPEGIAYVIYTSGSTGNPKGVKVSNRNLVSFFTGMNMALGQGRGTWLALTNYTFDISILELIWTLTLGFKVVLQRSITDITGTSAGDDHSIYAQLNRHQVTHLQATPSMAILLHTALSGLPAVASVKKVLMGGESLSRTLISHINRTFPAADVYNMYGPTETTIWSTCWKVEPATEKVLIGKPIANTRIYIVDRNDQLCPVGVTGEILIGGHGVADGYINKPLLTGQRFKDNPCRPGERIYRTGDIGKWTKEGYIEYIGRNDDQVKIRGHRVEPGEIEKALRSNNFVQTAAVIAQRGATGETELVAYWVGKELLTTPDIRTYLKKILPAYMLPDHFIRLDELPLTPNGKVDKKGLPLLTGTGAGSGREYASPRNITEERLIRCWKGVLNGDRIGVRDDFFESGGNSLKAIHLIGAIHKEFSVKLTLKELFTNSVLEDQALSIQQAKKTAFVDLAPAPVQKHYPLSSSQRLFWISCQFEEANIAYNIPDVHSWDGDLDLTVLQRAFDSLIERHESLRTVFQTDEEGLARQFILSPEKTGFRMTCRDLRQEGEEQLDTLLRSELHKPFDLASGPLLRVSLYRIADSKWILSYIIHHIISDGRSMTILIRELWLLYSTYAAGGSNPLSPLPVQYKDYAVWQQQQLSGDEMKEHKAYWLDQFEGELPVLFLSADKMRPAVKTYNGGIVHRPLDTSLSRNFKLLLRQQECTLFMGLLAAVNTLLYNYTDQTDIIIGTSIAGREHPGLEDQIGYYLNTLALRIRFSTEESFAGLLGNTKKLTLDAYSHQAYPFDELVEALDIRRDVSRNNLFDVLVVIRDTDFKDTDARIAGPGNIEVTRYKGVDQSASKFDLSFSFYDGEEGLEVSMEYNSDLFRRSSIVEIGEDLELLLSRIIQQPHIALGQLELIRRDKAGRSLSSLNDRMSEFGTAISNEF